MLTDKLYMTLRDCKRHIFMPRQLCTYSLPRGVYISHELASCHNHCRHAVLHLPGVFLNKVVTKSNKVLFNYIYTRTVERVTKINYQ